ncbi:MAG: hypothetical protein HQK75_03105 [Candidatus Magnetomorum sp.]|nr:hypothetical protein [Candidatus Magnetomorum sp.]
MQCSIHSTTVTRLCRRFFIINLCFLVWIYPGLSDDRLPFEVFETPYLILFYPSSLKDIKSEFVAAYDSAESNLNTIFKWRPRHKIQLVVINNRQTFLQMAEHPLTVAFAEMKHHRIVIDYQQVVTRPFCLETTVQHELCHILMDHYLKIPIPRWLNEGIAQWASEGIAEIIRLEANTLQKAAFSGNLIPLYKLDASFPMDSSQFILAYEQSKSFIVYLVNTYTKYALLELLDQIEQGQSLHEAVLSIYGKSWRELEREWIASQTQYMAWMVYISNNMYTFIFIGMAFLCIFGFIRIKLKKRDYPDDWDDDDWVQPLELEEQ